MLQTAQFRAGAAPKSIDIQFGYRPDQVAGIYLALSVLALVLTLTAAGLSKAGYLELNRSLFLVGTIVWMGIASWLHAAEPFRILLAGSPSANIMAALLEYCPPLLCIAVGAALGDKRPRGQVFGEIFWSFGMFLFPLASAMTAVPSITDRGLIDAVPWLAFAPVSVLICRWRIRSGSGTTVLQLSTGELKNRVSELAARAGHRDVRVLVSMSTRPQALNAFALLRNSVILTASLVRSLSKREVDAVVAHEISHFGHVRRSAWAALAIAAAIFGTPLNDFFVQNGVSLFLGILIPVTLFLAMLHGARKREFAADAGSAALTGDPQAMIDALVKISHANKRPMSGPAIPEWFSSHPSTEKRIQALAAKCNAAVEHPNADESYSLTTGEESAIFTLAWQNANATRYAWSALLGASAAGLLIAALLDKFAWSGFPRLIIGIVAGCALTKIFAATVMSANYARLARRLTRKLGTGGQLVGLAVDSEPRVYNGYRFSDAGFLSFDRGRLCYRSERSTIQLNAADVIEVGMVAAAPSSWRRLQPMIRFRRPESGETSAIILHPVEWMATPGRLLRSIEQWRTTAQSAEATSLNGLIPSAGQPFHVPTVAQTARGFRIPGAVTLVGATLAGWFTRGESWPAWCALLIAACAYTFMFLPAMLYRPAEMKKVTFVSTP